MNPALTLSIISIILSQVYAMYEGSNSKVVKLTAYNFNELVINSDDLWMVEFYAPWCGHCKNLEPHWDKAAKILKGIVKVGAVNMDEEKSLGPQYQIEGFPTIKFFGPNKKSPDNYQGGRDADDIVKFALQKVNQVVEKRLSGKNQQNQQSQGGSSDSGEVIVLNEQNFDSMVLASKDIWIVEFYAPWCGHCKNLEPEYAQAARNLKGQVKLGKVDATVEQYLGQRFGLQGYPTIKVFEYGPKSDSKAKSYDGERTANAITQYGLMLAQNADIEPELHELIKQNIYDQNCQGQRICIINFLPNIYDSNAKERNGYLNLIKQVAKLNRRHPFDWFWLQAGDQLDLERELNLGFGFPAVVAISPQKKLIATLKASYSKENLNQFLQDLLIGKGGLVQLQKPIQIKKAQKWDGKDAAPLEEESGYHDDL